MGVVEFIVVVSFLCIVKQIALKSSMKKQAHINKHAKTKNTTNKTIAKGGDNKNMSCFVMCCLFAVMFLLHVFVVCVVVCVMFCLSVWLVVDVAVCCYVFLSHRLP